MEFIGCPFIHTIHFSESSFTWTHVSTNTSSSVEVPGIVPYTIPQKPHKTRLRCAQCGVYVASHNASAQKWSVWGAHLQRSEDGRIIEDVWKRVKPTVHIFYGTHMVDIPDGLGKWEGYEGQSQKIVEN